MLPGAKCAAETQGTGRRDVAAVTRGTDSTGKQGPFAGTACAAIDGAHYGRRTGRDRAGRHAPGRFPAQRRHQCGSGMRQSPFDSGGIGGQRRSVTGMTGTPQLQAIAGSGPRGKPRWQGSPQRFSSTSHDVLLACEDAQRYHPLASPWTRCLDLYSSQTLDFYAQSLDILSHRAVRMS